MKILFIVHRFPPNSLGGADIYTYGIADELRRQGHSVWILCNETLHDPTTGPNEVRVTNDYYHDLPVRRLHLNWQKMDDPYGWLYISNPVIERLTRTYIDEIKPDIVHVTACDYVTNAVITAAKQAELPVILTLTGKWHICPMATLLRWDGQLCAGRQPGMTCLRCMFGETKAYRTLQMLPDGVQQKVIGWTGKTPELFRSNGSLNFVHAVERRNVMFEEVLAQVDHIISPSQCHRQIFDKSGVIPADRITYSPHGHNTQLAAQGCTKSPSSALRFGYTGRIASHKGADTLIQAFNQLKGNKPVVLNMYGGLDLESPFGQKVRELSKDNPSIIFHGAFDNQDIGNVLANIDVLVVPSNCVENAPVTIAEAFAAKTPVIGSDTCGVVEHINPGVTGLIFRRGDSNDLAQQMQLLVDQPDLLPNLKKGILPVRSTADEVAALLDLYDSYSKDSALASKHLQKIEAVLSS